MMDVGQANLVSSKTSRIQAQMPSKTAITVTSFNSCVDQSNNRQMILSSNFRICFGPTRRNPLPIVGYIASGDVAEAGCQASPLGANLLRWASPRSVWTGAERSIHQMDLGKSSGRIEAPKPRNGEYHQLAKVGSTWTCNEIARDRAELSFSGVQVTVDRPPREIHHRPSLPRCFSPPASYQSLWTKPSG